MRTIENWSEQVVSLVCGKVIGVGAGGVMVIPCCWMEGQIYRVNVVKNT